MSKLQAIRFNTNCAICYENYAEGDTLCSPEQCGHVFHKECLDNWLKCKKQCPTCRMNIITEAAPPAPILQTAATIPQTTAVRRPPPPPRRVPASTISNHVRSIPNIYKTLNFTETLTLFNILQGIMRPLVSQPELYDIIYNEIIEVLDTVFMVDQGCETAYELLNKIRGSNNTQIKFSIYEVSNSLYAALQQFIPSEGFTQNAIVLENYNNVCKLLPLYNSRQKYLNL